MNSSYDVIILGAGASGLMCALTAAKRGCSVALVDHALEAGRKITFCGGGKANFTNQNILPEHYAGKQRHFPEYALERFTTKHILRMFIQWGLPWEERELGQLFCLCSAKKLRDALTKECLDNGCTFYFAENIQHITKPTDTKNLQKDHSANFNVTLKENNLEASSLVLALGSPAWPQSGASPDGFLWAKQLGHSIVAPHPALVPFLMPDNWSLQGLSGISLTVCMGTQEHSSTDSLLFTHHGLSGPATLKTSLFWEEQQAVNINFLPHLSLEELLDAPECSKLTPRSLLARHLPQRLVDALLPTDIARRKNAELSRKDRLRIVHSIHNYQCVPEKTAGLLKAEACRGGVDTHDIDPYTMESLICPHCYIVGELLDVTGILGGYNLHWAWASGVIAGESVKAANKTS